MLRECWRKRFGAAALALSGLLLMPAGVSAQDWPTRPVRIVSPFAAGGSADILARLVAEHLSTAFKQQFYVETRTGAGGAIGVQAIVNSPPDGYSFVITNVSLLSLLPVSNLKLGYDPVRDLTNIAFVAGSPVVLAVNPAKGGKSVQEFLALAKKSGKPLTYSSSGLGTNGHLVGESLSQKAGIKIEHIPYKGASQGINDLVGGHIDFGLPVMGSVSSQVRGNALLALAHTASERMPDYPDVPTFKELGYPDIVTTTWFSLSGPAGLPRPIAEKVNREIAAMMARPDVKARLRRDGMLSQIMSIDEFGAFIAAETARWKPIIEQAGLVGKVGD